MALSILVVEDEDAIRVGVCDLLAFHGHEPTGVASGEEGLRRALEDEYALVVLDVMLPEVSGFEVCRRIRAARPEQAVLMLTARGGEQDVLEGFRAGADDYVTKPFSVSELAARVEALLRRSGRLPPPGLDPFPFAGWEVDPTARVARAASDEVELTAREVALLSLLVRERGRIVGRRRLLADVWGLRRAAGIHTRTIDVHFAKLRKKLERHAPNAIETVRGEGYRFAG